MYEYVELSLGVDVLNFMRKLDLNTRSLGQDNIRALIDSNGNITACAFIEFNENLTEIFVLGVDEEYRRQGVGSFFVDKIIENLADNYVRKVSVEPKSEQAVRFWESKNFIEIPYAKGNYGYSKMEFLIDKP